MKILGAFFALLWLLNHVSMTQSGYKVVESEISRQRIRLKGGNAHWMTEVYRQELLEAASIPRRIMTESAPLLSNRLAVMIIFSLDLTMPLTEHSHRRVSYLHCSVSLLKKNMGTFTPLDVYIWIRPSQTIHPVLMQLVGTYIMNIQLSSWKAEGTTFNSNWNMADIFKEDFYLMDRWRNTFQFDFVRELGYEYFVQMDDDTFITDLIDVNLVKHMKEHQIYLASRNSFQMEPVELIQGLPEFVRYWMLTRNMSEPIGDLFNQLTPPNMVGLTTQGWSRVSLVACFAIFDVNYWFQDIIQDFVRLMLRTGSDVEQRWLEQSLQNMAVRLFYPVSSVMLLEWTILHGKPSVLCLPELDCASTVTVVGEEIPVAAYQEGSQLYFTIVDPTLTVHCFVYKCELTLYTGGSCEYTEEESYEYIISNRLRPLITLFFEKRLKEALPYRYFESLSSAIINHWLRNRAEGVKALAHPDTIGTVEVSVPAL